MEFKVKIIENGTSEEEFTKRKNEGIHHGNTEAGGKMEKEKTYSTNKTFTSVMSLRLM